MALQVDYGKVRLGEACSHIIRSASEAALMQTVAEHAKPHTLAPTPELIATVKDQIGQT